MSWVFPSAQRTISYNEFKPATDMVSQHVFRSRIRIGAIAQNHIAPPPGRTHSCHSFHAFHCCRQCVYLHRFSSPLQHVASVHSWSIDELHVYAENERIWHLLHAHMQFTYTQNGVHQHWISNCREFQRVPQSASTCLFANSPHARFFGLPSWAWRLASFERRQRSHCALDVTAVLSLARGLFASLGTHLSLVSWVQANALSVNTQMPILTEKHLTRRVWNSMFFCAYVLHQLCALRSIRLCLAAGWAKGVAVKTINLRTSERRPSTLAYKLARISARATSASTCLFANRLHALASKDMCTKPMTPKIQVAVELPATLMLLGDTEGMVLCKLCPSEQACAKKILYSPSQRDQPTWPPIDECRWRSQNFISSCLEVI